MSVRVLNHIFGLWQNLKPTRGRDFLFQRNTYPITGYKYCRYSVIEVTVVINVVIVVLNVFKSCQLFYTVIPWGFMLERLIQKEEKHYKYWDILLSKILKARADDNHRIVCHVEVSPTNPQNLAPTIAMREPPATKDLVQAKLSRFKSKGMRAKLHSCQVLGL